MIDEVQPVAEALGVDGRIGWLVLTAALAGLSGWAGAEALKKILVSLRKARIWREVEAEVAAKLLPAVALLAEVNTRAKVDPPGWVALLVGASAAVGVAVGAILGWRLEYDDAVVGAVVGLAAGLSPGWIVRRVKARGGTEVEEVDP